MGKPKLIKLKNGATIIYKRRKMCNASAVNVGFFVGHKDCQDFMPGLSHFMEHSLFLGTINRTKQQIKNEQCKHYINASTNHLKLDVKFFVSNREIKDTLDFVSDILLNSSFPEEEIKNELGVVFEERELRKSEFAHDFPFQHMLTLYGDNYFDMDAIIGNENDLGKVTSSDLFAFRNKYFTVDNFFCAITTSLPYYKVKKLINKYFISHIENKHCPKDHDRHFLSQIVKPRVKIVNDNTMSSFKIKITNVFKAKKEEFLYDNTIDFLNWFNYMHVDNFYKKARDLGLIYAGSQSIINLNAREFCFNEFKFETSKFENIETVLKLINENINYIKSVKITNEDIKTFIEKECIDHDKAFPLAYKTVNYNMLDDYCFLDKLVPITFKQRLKKKKKITVSQVEDLIKRIYNQNNDFYITIMGPTDNLDFKTVKEYKNILFKK